MTIPRSTQAYKLASFDKSFDGLEVQDVPLPSQLEPTQVLVEIHAVSLNARDYQSEFRPPPSPTPAPTPPIPPMLLVYVR